VLPPEDPLAPPDEAPLTPPDDAPDDPPLVAPPLDVPPVPPPDDPPLAPPVPRAPPLPAGLSGLDCDEQAARNSAAPRARILTRMTGFLTCAPLPGTPDEPGFATAAGPPTQRARNRAEIADLSRTPSRAQGHTQRRLG
jgi:hypothetical protein